MGAGQDAVSAKLDLTACRGRSSWSRGRAKGWAALPSPGRCLALRAGQSCHRTAGRLVFSPLSPGIAEGRHTRFGGVLYSGEGLSEQCERCVTARAGKAALERGRGQTRDRQRSRLRSVPAPEPSSAPVGGSLLPFSLVAHEVIGNTVPNEGRRKESSCSALLFFFCNF